MVPHLRLRTNFLCLSFSLPHSIAFYSLFVCRFVIGWTNSISLGFLVGFFLSSANWLSIAEFGCFFDVFSLVVLHFLWYISSNFPGPLKIFYFFDLTSSLIQTENSTYLTCIYTFTILIFFYSFVIWNVFNFIDLFEMSYSLRKTDFNDVKVWFQT